MAPKDHLSEEIIRAQLRLSRAKEQLAMGNC